MKCSNCNNKKYYKTARNTSIKKNINNQIRTTNRISTTITTVRVKTVSTKT
jgi:hypothetical protein